MKITQKHGISILTIVLIGTIAGFSTFMFLTAPPNPIRINWTGRTFPAPLIQNSFFYNLSK